MARRRGVGRTSGAALGAALALALVQLAGLLAFAAAVDRVVTGDLKFSITTYVPAQEGAPVFLLDTSPRLHITSFSWNLTDGDAGANPTYTDLMLTCTVPSEPGQDYGPGPNTVTFSSTTSYGYVAPQSGGYAFGDIIHGYNDVTAAPCSNDQLNCPNVEASTPCDEAAALFAEGSSSNTSISCSRGGLDVLPRPIVVAADGVVNDGSVMKSVDCTATLSYTTFGGQQRTATGAASYRPDPSLSPRRVVASSNLMTIRNETAVFMTIGLTLQGDAPGTPVYKRVEFTCNGNTGFGYPAPGATYVNFDVAVPDAMTSYVECKDGKLFYDAPTGNWPTINEATVLLSSPASLTSYAIPKRVRQPGPSFTIAPNPADATNTSVVVGGIAWSLTAGLEGTPAYSGLVVSCVSDNGARGSVTLPTPGNGTTSVGGAVVSGLASVSSHGVFCTATLTYDFADVGAQDPANTVTHPANATGSAFIAPPNGGNPGPSDTCAVPQPPVPYTTQFQIACPPNVTVDRVGTVAVNGHQLCGLPMPDLRYLIPGGWSAQGLTMTQTPERGTPLFADYGPAGQNPTWGDGRNGTYLVTFAITNGVDGSAPGPKGSCSFPLFVRDLHGPCLGGSVCPARDRLLPLGPGACRAALPNLVSELILTNIQPACEGPAMPVFEQRPAADGANPANWTVPVGRSVDVQISAKGFPKGSVCPVRVWAYRQYTPDVALFPPSPAVINATSVAGRPPQPVIVSLPWSFADGSAGCSDLPDACRLSVRVKGGAAGVNASGFLLAPAPALPLWNLNAGGPAAADGNGIPQYRVGLWGTLPDPAPLSDPAVPPNAVLREYVVSMTCSFNGGVPGVQRYSVGGSWTIAVAKLPPA